MTRIVPHLLLPAALVGLWRPLPGQARPPAPADTGCGRYVRNTGRAELCGRVVDGRTGVGVGGGDARFVRIDGREMNGPIGDDGRFNLNVDAGHGTLTLQWSCRAQKRLVDTLTLAAGRGTRQVFSVEADASDTLCRVATDRGDTSSAAVLRWRNHGPCLSITYGPWRPQLDERYLPASWVRLDLGDPRSSVASRVQPLMDRPPVAPGWRSRGWRPIQGDSLELYWSTGFSAVTLTLGHRADSLVGHALWTFDVVIIDSLGFEDLSSLPRAQVSARSVACP